MPSDFCERVHRLEFEPSGADVTFGESVELEAGLGLSVIRVSDGRRIGDVVDGRASAIEQCLTRGYRFRGEVIEIRAERGRIAVRGARG